MSQFHPISPSALSRERRRLLGLIHAAAGEEPADLVLKNARYVNVFSQEVCRQDIAVKDGVIVGLGDYRGREEIDLSGRVVCPGFIDAHIHLESSLVTPWEFARSALPHGTAAVIADPHEIANVMGLEGISYMLQATQGLPMEVFFMLPSCVPSAPLDESGAALDWADIDPCYRHPRVLGLGEMMNAYGVVHGEEPVLDRLAAARLRGRPVDGHAPGLTGRELEAYVCAGISSDHESTTLEEALEKLRLGQLIMIREGTAAHNLAALAPLLSPRYARRCALCSDDRHPGDLLEKGHMDGILRQAVCRYGADPVSAVTAATWSAAQHFGLRDRGAIAPGYRADLVVVDNLRDFTVEKLFLAGQLWWDGTELRPFSPPPVDSELLERARSSFRVRPLTPGDFAPSGSQAVMGLVPRQIITDFRGFAREVDLSRDILRLAVIERHRGTGRIGLGYLQGYGLRAGAVATSVAHDSHNIISAGTAPEDMAFAANRIREMGGGIVVVQGEQVLAEVPLEIGGVMSGQPMDQVNARLEGAKEAARRLGVNPDVDPFMTLSFLSLPVIPEIRLTPGGALRVSTQEFF